MCHAGERDSNVYMDCFGNVYRCVMAGPGEEEGSFPERIIGNVFDDDFAFMDKPAPCPVMYCAAICNFMNFNESGCRETVHKKGNFILEHLKHVEWPEGKHKPCLVGV